MKKNPTNKQQAWDAKISYYKHDVHDALGKKIDPGVLDAVVALNLMGYKTLMSCEGHIDHGTGGPYIDVEVTGAEKQLAELEAFEKTHKMHKPKSSLESQDFQEWETLRQKIDDYSLTWAKGLQKILDLYRRKNSSSSFVVDSIYPGAVRIEPKEILDNDLVGGDQKKEMLNKYQKDLAELSAFLKAYYFNN